MKIIMVRHGEPDYEHDSLTEKGFREADLLANFLKKYEYDEIYCSPLGRAVRTSEPTLKMLGKKATTLDFLEEFPGKIINPLTGARHIAWDFLPSYWTKNPDLYDPKKWYDVPIMQTGDVKEVYFRVIKEFDEFLADHGYIREGNYYKAVKPNKDTILFFCHFGIQSVLLAHLIGVSPLVLWQGLVALPTGITTIQTEERQEGIAYFRCRGFGELPHLYEAGETPSEAAAFCEVFSDKDARH
ncbi:MAG: histidine phosphatase family protein [Clostridia bacterium]|nr:histidine phosphatase family protein [Clostridia bacterium]